MVSIGFYSYFTFRCHTAGVCDKIPFDSETWQFGQANETYIRIRMVDDLRSNHALLGMTQDAIDDLLGPGRTETLFDCDYIYWLGPERQSFIVIDSEFLCLNFVNGKVSEHKLVVD